LLGKQIGGDDRLISLRRSVVGNKEVAVGDAAQRNGGKTVEVSLLRPRRGLLG
jgi:hypothetical protein